MATSTACPPWRGEQKQSDGYNGQMKVKLCHQTFSSTSPSFHFLIYLLLCERLRNATVNHTRLPSRLSSALAATPHLSRHQALCCCFLLFIVYCFADSDCGSRPPAAPTSGTLPPSGSQSCEGLKSQTINLNCKENICDNFP